MIRPLAARLAAIALGLTVFFSVGEVVARIFFDRVIVYDIEMWKMARQLKHRVGAGGQRFENAPGRRLELMGVPVATNADGMRDREHSPIPPPRTKRIAVLGDSITFGWGVRVEESYPARLEALLNERRPLGPGISFEVLNFGVGNYNADDEKEMLARKVWPYEPDLVLVGLFINDAEPTRTLEEHFLLKHSAFAVFIWGRVQAALRSAGELPDYRAYYQDLYRENSPGLATLGAAFTAMATECRTRGVRLVAALLPELHAAGADYPFETEHRVLEAMARARGIRLLDLRAALPAGDPRRLWVSRDDAHPNAEAHAAYARFLADSADWSALFRGEPRGMDTE